MLNLADTHAHLDGIDDVDARLAQAAEAGVTKVVAVGVDLASNRINFDIQKRCSSPQIFLAFGIHPGNIITEQIDEMINFIREHKSNIVAIGETGLDFWYPWAKKDPKKKEEQIKVFQLQLDLAKEFDLPIIVHSRGAWQESFEMVKAAGIKSAVFHWYSGPLDILQQIIRAGFMISATPALYYSPQHQEALKNAPLQNILIETDSPVFYQNSEGGFNAGPKDVVRTLGLLAQIKNKPEEEVKLITSQNAVKFFNLKNG